MTFPADEKSVTQSRPIELYEFTAPNNTYRYTSWYKDYSFGGDTYTAVPLSRTDVAGTSQNDPPAVDITCDDELQIVVDFLRTQERSLTLKITRVQQVSGASLVWWEGEVSAITVQHGGRAKIRSESDFGNKLDSAIPGVSFQPLCNHRLYDARCTVLESARTTSTTIDSITDSVTIVVNAVGANTHKNGELIHTPSGERRLIVDQSGTTLTIASPFPDSASVSATDAVDVLEGCDHTVQTCRDQFSNVENFGGHPYIPSINPVRAGLKAAELLTS